MAMATIADANSHKMPARSGFHWSRHNNLWIECFGLVNLAALAPASLRYTTPVHNILPDGQKL